MKKVLLVALAALVLAAAVPAQPPKVYATGRVEPKRMLALLAESHNRHEAMLKALPSADDKTYDCSADLGPVKDQGQCGSCWDFSGVAVVEGAHRRAGKGLVFSEQYVLDCGQNGGCNGDDNTSVLKDAKQHGLPLSAAYGDYKHHAGQCHDTPSLTKFKIADWGFCDGTGQGVTDTQRVKDCMKKFGPIGCAIAADQRFMNVRPNEVFSGNDNQINHDIVLVGWDDAKGAWRLRNSWGTSWCDNGHCWIKYGANSVGTEAVFAFLEAPQPPPPPPPPGPDAGGGNAGSILLGCAIACVLVGVGFALGRITAPRPVVPKESKP